MQFWRQLCSGKCERLVVLGEEMKAFVNYRGWGGGREANRSITAKRKASARKGKMSRDSW